MSNLRPRFPLALAAYAMLGAVMASPRFERRKVTQHDLERIRLAEEKRQRKAQRRNGGAHLPAGCAAF